MTDIVNTKSSFQLRGIISGLSGKKNFGYEEGVLTKGNSAGKKFKKIKFYVQTSNHNKIPVELFGFEKDKVCFYNRDTKTHKMIPWSARLTTKLQGYDYILSEYDLVDKLNQEFKDGDSVFVNGELQFSEYENNQGNVTNQTRYIIKSVYATNSILEPKHFDEENFKEENSFQQEIIIDSIEESNKDKRIYVHCFTHDFKGLHNTTLEIDTELSSEIMKRNFKRLRTGDFLRVHGVINFLSEREEINGDWGKEVVVRVNKSLVIHGASAESIEKGKYKEEDLTGIIEEDNSILDEEKSLGFSLDN